jgi:GH43 family beta-xylosidase
MADLHPQLNDVESLLGTWTGTGRGVYPTIEPFEYTETITFEHVGKPFLAYAQRTRSIATGMPMHAESGYWRFPAPGLVEVVLSHPTGITEIEQGTLITEPSGVIIIELVSRVISMTTSAKTVAALERSFRIDGDVLDYQLSMSAVGLPLQHHLGARLVRT